jgi:hypothetical protein
MSDKLQLTKEKLYEAINKEGIESEEVLLLSEMLDNIIIEYYKNADSVA